MTQPGDLQNDGTYRSPGPGVAVLTHPNVAILTADIELLHPVTDSEATRINEELRRAVVGRLTRLIRPEDQLAHLTARKILIFCEDLEDISTVDALMAQIDTALNGTFSLQRKKMTVCCTVRISYAGRSELIPAQILRDSGMHVQRAQSYRPA